MNISAMKWVIGALFLVFGGESWAGGRIPNCEADGRTIQVNNDQVIQWKETTPNQYKDRALIKGQVIEVLRERKTHLHISIQIGKRASDVIEAIYNVAFGAINEVQEGVEAIACGDYITATEQTGPYPPSPAGAIIHWLHMNPRGEGHEGGFLMLNGIVYGQEPEASHRSFEADYRLFWNENPSYAPFFSR